MSRRGIVLRTPRTRYKRSNRDDTLDQAALQFDLDVSTFSKEEKVAVLNSVRNLYAGRNQVTAMAEASLRLLSTAFGVILTEDDDDDSIRDKISPRFFSADQINGLVLSRVRDSSLDLLRDWASTLGLPIAEDMAAPAASISSAIIAARGAPESPKRYSIDTLAPLSTEDLRKRRRLLGDGLVDADLLRPQLISDLLGQQIPAVLPVSPFQAGEEQLIPGMQVVADEVPSVLPLRSVAVENVPIGPDTNVSLDGLFADYPSSLEELYRSFFVKVPVTQLQAGMVVGQFATDVTPFQVISVQASVSIKSVVDHSVFGSVSNISYLWVLSAEGLDALSELLKTPPLPVIAGRPVVIDITGESPSVSHLLRQRSSVLALSRSSASSVVTGSDPLLGQGETGGLLARHDRYEEARGLRTLLRQDMTRFYAITNNTGKLSVDVIYNNLILLVPLSDRELPAVSRKFMRHLATLQFSLTFDPDKPVGLHLQAFRVEGKPFFSVGNIRDALMRMAQLLDLFRSGHGVATRFFSDLFSGLIELLSRGAELGFADLPVPFVLSRITNILLEFGVHCNSPAADSWMSDELQRRFLLPVLKVDVALNISLASVQALKSHQQRTPAPSREKSRPGSRPSSFAPRASGSSSSRSSPPGSSSAMGVSGSTSATGGTGSGSAGSSSSSGGQVQGLCISTLLHKYALGPGCTRTNCSFPHDLSRASKDDLRAVAARVNNASLKSRLLTAIG